MTFKYKVTSNSQLNDNEDFIEGPITNKNFPSKEKISRNAPCPCGSGKKYKHCCGKI